jgi:predicted AlkP superfamily pyrophosphatase or phosphodiesterase
MFVQFYEADGAGHSSGYGTATQLAKIAEIDAYIGQIYASYEQKGILNETLFIVTADHGGNGTNHGGLTDTENIPNFSGKILKTFYFVLFVKKKKIETQTLVI